LCILHCWPENGNVGSKHFVKIEIQPLPAVINAIFLVKFDTKIQILMRKIRSFHGRAWR